MSDLNPQTIYDIPQQLNKELLFDNFSITNSIPSATSTLSYINHSTNQINDKNNQTTVSNSDNDTINDSDDTDDEYDIDDKDINDVLSYKEFKQLNSVGSNLDINFAKIITINLCKDSLITIPNKIVDEFSLANNQMFKLSDQNTILKPIVIELPVAKKHNYTLKSFLFRDSSIVLLIIDETIQTKLINNYIKEIDHYSHGDSNIIILNLSKKKLRDTSNYSTKYNNLLVINSSKIKDDNKVLDIILKSIESSLQNFLVDSLRNLSYNKSSQNKLLMTRESSIKKSNSFLKRKRKNSTCIIS